MKTVYKYGLNFDRDGSAQIEVPKNSAFLKMGVQDNSIVLWYLVDKSVEDTHIEKFQVKMTGEEFEDDDLEYIDTVILQGWIVCHVFMILDCLPCVDVI